MCLQMEVAELRLLIPPFCLYIHPRVHVIFRSSFFIAFFVILVLFSVPTYAKIYVRLCMHLERTSLNSEPDYKRLEFVLKTIN